MSIKDFVHQRTKEGASLEQIMSECVEKYPLYVCNRSYILRCMKMAVTNKEPHP